LQGKPGGGKTAFQKPLAANAMLQRSCSSQGRRAGPIAKGKMGLADPLKNLEDSVLDFRCCFVVVQPHREVLDAVVPVLRRLGMKAPRDMKMVFMLTTKRTLRMSLIAPDFEKLAHPAHANRVWWSTVEVWVASFALHDRETSSQSQILLPERWCSVGTTGGGAPEGPHVLGDKLDQDVRA